MPLQYAHSNPELLMSSGMQFSVQNRSQAQSIDIPQQQRAPAVTFPFCPPKRQPQHPASAKATLEWGWDGQEGKAVPGSAQCPAKPCRSPPTGKTHFKMSQSRGGDTQLPLKDIQQLLSKHSGENLPGNRDLSAATLPQIGFC